jgi:Holliday junction resolvase-like predicted endonuclease
MTERSKQNFSLYDKYRLYPDLVIDEAVNRVRGYLQILLERANQPETGDNIGLILESLARILLESPYLNCNRMRRNCKAGEIDLDFKVSKFPTTLFEEFDYLLIVECKNWGKKAGAPDLRVFCSKMREASSKVSIFFSKQGITKDAKVVIRDAWLVDKIIVLVFDIKDLDRIINQSENLYTILHEKYIAVRTSSKD